MDRNRRSTGVGMSEEEEQEVAVGSDGGEFPRERSSKRRGRPAMRSTSSGGSPTGRLVSPYRRHSRRTHAAGNDQHDSNPPGTPQMSYDSADEHEHPTGGGLALGLENDQGHDQRQPGPYEARQFENNVNAQGYRVIKPSPLPLAMTSNHGHDRESFVKVPRALVSVGSPTSTNRPSMFVKPGPRDEFSSKDPHPADLSSLVRHLQAQVETLTSKLEKFVPEVIGKDVTPPWSHAVALQPKEKLVLMGTFPDSGRLTINLCGANSIPFSFDVRFSSVSRKNLEIARNQKRSLIRAEPAVEINEVLVTSNPDSKIQEDNVAIVEPVILKESPFQPGSDFTLEICCYWGHFVVLSDGKFLLDYKYRVPLSQIQSIYILGSPGYVHSVEKKPL